MSTGFCLRTPHCIPLLIVVANFSARVCVYFNCLLLLHHHCCQCKLLQRKHARLVSTAEFQCKSIVVGEQLYDVTYV